MLELKIQEHLLNSPLKVISVRHEIFEPGASTSWGIMEYPRLLLINSGELEYIFYDESFTAKQGSIIHLPGGKMRNWRVIGEESVDLSWFLYDTNTPCRNYCGISETSNIQTELEAHNRLRSAYLNAQPVNQILQEAEAKSMLIRFFRNSTEPNAKQDNKKVRLHHKLEKVLKIINEEAGNPEILGELHSRIGLSVNHFRIIFKQGLGLTPGKYLQNYRLSKASMLLSEGNLSVKEVAYTVGYHDAQYFSRIYHRHYGYPPSQEPVILA